MKSDVSVAVASRSFSRHPILRAELLSLYPNTTFNDTEESFSGERLIGFLKGHTKAITALEVLDESVFTALPELKVVSKYGVGLDMIDLKAMEKHGVLLGWTGGVNKRSVAELAICAMISLLHRVPEANLEVRKGKWRQITGKQLTGKTVGIIGCGHIGKDLAMLLRAFGCEILSRDILNFPKFYEEYKVTPVELEELLTRSDIVTLHVPLDDSTRNMLDSVHLDMMKKGAFLINMARGDLVEEGKVKQMLKDGRLGGAAFDVFTNEPPDDLELLGLSNVIVSPHIGGSTEEAILAMGRAAIHGLDSPSTPARLINQ